MAHAHAGVPCEHPTKKACELARRAAMGQCTEMIDSKSDPYPCKNWAIDRIEGRGYCGQHIAAVARAADDRRRSQERRAQLDRNIDIYIAWRFEHPSVWDRMAES